MKADSGLPEFDGGDVAYLLPMISASRHVRFRRELTVAEGQSVLPSICYYSQSKKVSADAVVNDCTRSCHPQGLLEHGTEHVSPQGPILRMRPTRVRGVLGVYPLCVALQVCDTRSGSVAFQRAICGTRGAFKVEIGASQAPWPWTFLLTSEIYFELHVACDMPSKGHPCRSGESGA